MLKRSVPGIPERFKTYCKPALFALLAIYLLNCFSPLRLEYDSIKYFALKDCLEQRCPPGFNPAGDPHPYGYPLLLLLLSKMGLLHSFTVALINGCYLVGGLYFVKEIFRANVPPFLFFGLLLLNWTFIKFFNYPLSEMQYLFFSGGSLYSFHLYTQQRKIGMLLLTFALGGLAFLTRTAGMALLPALLVGLAWEHRSAFNGHRRRNGMLMLLLLLLLLAGILLFPDALHLTHYLKSLGQDRPGMGAVLLGHFKEWGQLLLNTPSGKIGAWLQGADNWLFLPAGIGLFGWFGYALFLRRATLPLFITIYLVSYCVLIFNWPFFDPRFWIPVLPLIAVLLLQTPLPGARVATTGTGARAATAAPSFVRTIGRLLFIAYIFAGVGAVGYSTYTAFHKEALARSQAKGIFRNEYEVFFFGRPQSDTATHFYPYVLHLLEKYH
jgi:hypothetical protein